MEEVSNEAASKSLVFFSQWHTTFEKTRTVRQVTWLSGQETILQEDIIERVKEVLSPRSFALVPLVIGEDSERTVWEEISYEPMDSSFRLVIIRNADKLQHPERLEQFLKDRTENPNTYLVFVSNEKNLPRLTPERGKKNGELPSYLNFGAKGHIVECKPFTQATADKAVDWVMKRTGVNRQIAGYLLDRSNGNLRLVRDVSAKLIVFDGEISITTINQMLAEIPRDDLADALLALKKPEALLALEHLSPSEYSATIGLLDQRLDFIGMMHDMQSQLATQAEITRAAGNKNFLVKDLLPIAKHYDPKRRLAIRNLLAMVDEYLQAGVTEGILQTVIFFW